MISFLMFLAATALLFGILSIEEPNCEYPEFHDPFFWGLITFGGAFVITLLVAVTR